MSATLEGQAYGLRVTEVRPGINDTHFSNQPGQREADAALLAEGVQDPATRAFLLQNLTHTENGWAWKANLNLLLDSLDVVMDFPEQLREHTFDGPVLWMAGGRSDYVQEQFRPAMEALFPRTRLVTIKGAGHWVHSEEPEVFHQTLRNFLLEKLT